MPVRTAPVGHGAPEAPGDELGAHVSVAGGVHMAPSRATEIGARVLQLFTKQPNRWAEPVPSEETVAAFRAARIAEGILTCVSHDSYLINLASPDPTLLARSLASFQAELTRCARLGLDALVTHPGNATDGDREAGIARNGEALAQALAAVPGPTRVLLELTAGSGTSVGGSFENLAALLSAIPGGLRTRVGVCVDLCHAWTAGYDLVGDYDGVWSALESAFPLERVELFHLNDSSDPLGSHRDRHRDIGEGHLGEAFRRLLTDSRFVAIPKLIETPKGDDPVAADRKNLARLRAYRTSSPRGTEAAG